MKINEQNRAEYDAEKQTFIAAQKAWEANEISLREQQKTLQDELVVARSKVTNAEESVSLLRGELHQAQLALKEWQVQHLTTVHTVELLRGELRAANDKCQELQTELKKRRAKLRAKVNLDQ
jgi:chromosome segregation ATPase